MRLENDRALRKIRVLLDDLDEEISKLRALEEELQDRRVQMANALHACDIDLGECRRRLEEKRRICVCGGGVSGSITHLLPQGKDQGY